MSASLEPGSAPSTVGALTLVSRLTFRNDSIYDVDLDTVAATADKVIANGATLGSSARINVLAREPARFPSAPSLRSSTILQPLRFPANSQTCRKGDLLLALMPSRLATAGAMEMILR